MRRFVSLLLCVVLVLSMAACSPPAEETESPAPQALPEGKVLDAAGNVLEMPDGDITAASVYAVSVPFLVALDITDRVVAVNCKSNFWTGADESLKAAGTVGRGVVDLEALATYAPTVLIHRANDRETTEAVQALGVDVLCISAEDMDGIYSTLALMGEYFGATERANEVIEWMNGKFAKVDVITARITEEERVTALCMGGELGRIAGGDMLQSWMIEKAGGVCVARGTENDSNWLTVGVEKVFEWDPQFIFCTSSTPLDYTAEEVLTDPNWSACAAVKDGRVELIPAKIDSWDMPGVAPVLGTFWMLHEMYPEYFSQEELQAEIDDYYSFMFGQSFEADYLGYKLD